MISWKVQNKKFCTKIKNIKFGPKMSFLNVLDWNLKKLVSYLKSTPSNLSKYQTSSKTTTITATTENGTKIALCGYFWCRILKNYSHIWNHHLRTYPIANFTKKKKWYNLGPKMSYLGIFVLEFLKDIVIFEIRTLKFDKL